MKRREFIKVILGSAVWPLATDVQPSNKPVIGFLSARSAKESAHLVDAFRKGLAEHGLVEGQNVTIEYRWADSHYERLAGQASDLLTRQPTVLISVGGDMTAKAAATATKSTPIVAVFIGDPVAGGYVASLGRPGGNITGVSNLNAVIEAKRIGLLRDVKPGITTVGALLNPDSVTAATQRKDIEEAARTIGLKVEFLEAKNDPELEAAFKSIVANRFPALLVPADAFFAAARDRLAELAAQNRVPAIYSLRESVVGVKRTCFFALHMSAYDPKRTLMLQNHLSECSLSVCSFATIQCPILTVRDDDEAARVHHASQLRGGDLAARCPRAAA